MTTLKNKSLILTVAFALVLLIPKSILAEDRLSVSNVSTKDQPANELSWPSGKGTVTIERSDDGGVTFSTVGTTDFNFFVDSTTKDSQSYIYKVSGNGFSLTSASALDSNAKPTVSIIKLSPGATSKDESSVIVTFKTDVLSKAQVFYGQSASYGSQTNLEDNLNQSHTILIEKLIPGTTYHLKIKATNKDGSQSTESDDQMFVTNNPPQDQSIMKVIVDALTRAFSGFSKWFNS